MATHDIVEPTSQASHYVHLVWNSEPCQTSGYKEKILGPLGTIYRRYKLPYSQKYWQEYLVILG